MKIKALEKLENEFKTADSYSKIIINNCLLDEIENEDFAKRILIPEKTIKGMFDFIKSCAKQVATKGAAKLSEGVVYSLAIHYFQEDKPKFIKEMMKEETIKFKEKHSKNVIKKLDQATVIIEETKIIEKKAKKIVKVEKKKEPKKIPNIPVENNMSIFDYENI